MAAKEVPTVNDIAQAATQSNEQIVTAVGTEVTDILDSLIAGKNPLASNTIRINGIGIVVGLVGTAYQAWATGDIQSVMPFLVLVGAGAINTVLRFLTSGPLITAAQQKIQDSLLNINVKGN